MVKELSNTSSLSAQKWWTLLLFTGMGSIIEFYDFIIITAFAVPIGMTFFPSSVPSMAALSTLTVFAAGWLMRPFGAVIFGYFGDRFGRKRVFVYSILLMAIPSFIIACLPSHHTLGISATLVFVMLRILQGATVSGEISGSIVVAYESTATRKTFFCASVIGCIVLGAIFAHLVSLALHALIGQQAFNRYGWRIAIMVGALFGFIGFLLRKQLHETDEFINATKHPNSPLATLFNNYWRTVIRGVFMAIPQSLAAAWLLLLPLYMHLIGGYSSTMITLVGLLSAVLLFIFTVGFGLTSDKHDWTVFRLSLSLCIPCTIFVFFCLYKHWHPLLALVVFLAASGGVSATYSTILASFFPVDIRYSGVAITQNVAFAIFGGLTPVVNIFLLHRWPLAPMYFFSIFFALSLLVACFGLQYNLFDKRHS